MTRPVKFSIVTPSYNQGRFLGEAIESVRRQHWADVEHIIVDNCSGDETAALMERHADLRWVCEPDDGQSDALNKGFRLATGDIIGWLNADDRYLPGAFSTIATAMNASDADVVYGDTRWIDSQGEVTRLRREIGPSDFLLKYLHVLTIPTASSFFRRRVTDHELLDETYHYAMDYEYYLRLREHGYSFAHVPEFLADFRFHDQSKSSTSAAVQREEMHRALCDAEPKWAHRPERLARAQLAGLRLMARTVRTTRKLRAGCYRRGTAHQSTRAM